MKAFVNVMAGAIALGLYACGGGDQAGALHMRAASKTLITDSRVTSMYVEIQGVDNNWAGIRGAAYNTASDNTGEWSFEVDRIPVGNVSIFAEARGVHGEAIFRVREPRPIVMVKAHAIADVTLYLQEVKVAAPVANTAPFIQSLTVTSQEIDNATTIGLAATVLHDGTDLTYEWSDHDAKGAFSDCTGLQTSWTPPADGDFKINFSVTDSQDATASLDVTVQVAARYGKGGIATVIDFNSSPVLERIVTSGAQARAGQPLQLAAFARDIDGDLISYGWQSDCGTFAIDPAGENLALFTPAAAGPCTVNLTLTDYRVPKDEANQRQPRGGMATGSLALWVGETKLAVGPQFYVRFSSPVVLAPGQKAEVQVIPMSGAAEPTWSYAWSDGSMGGTFADRTEDGFTDCSDAWYTPAACADRSGDFVIPISVVVTDTVTQATNLESLSLTLRCP